MYTNRNNNRDGHFNIASYLPEIAKEHPYKKAVIYHKKGTDYTFFELDTISNRYAAGFLKLGFKKGDRVVLLVRPGLDFIAITFALFKAGLVPVLIDPGMGKDNLFKCIAEVRPKGFIAVPIAHAVRVANSLFKKDESLKSVEHFITVGRKWFWGGVTLKDIACEPEDTSKFCRTKRSDTAAILFTTGSTGIPKGVVYEHGMFDAQVRVIKDMYNITEDDVDLPAFPLFALFDTAWGITSVIPDMNPAKPAEVDPKKIIEAIAEHKVTITFGSPAIWDKVGEYCVKRSIKIPSLKRILMAGAPVPGEVLSRFKKILPPVGETHTPYGATESLPVTSISGTERLGRTEELTRAGKGCCVGKPVNGMTVKIIRLTDDRIDKWSDSLILPKGEIGEIAVKGGVVTKQYFSKKKETEAAKITDGDGVWHRMGDTGYFDKDGRLWFCGRKAHRVVMKGRVLFSVMCEGVFNGHGDVFRSALIGLGEMGDMRPVIIIEPREGKMPDTDVRRERFREEILSMARGNKLTKDIKDVLFHDSFPVDIRHNAKIFREKLAKWAQQFMVS
jgi:acyl-CoA synthetase (AMP-forming)/AMP-acid ligase II